MEVKHRQNGKEGVFYIEVDHTEIGIMHYKLSEANNMVIDHTAVDRAYEGRGFGRELIMAGGGYAREHHIKIIPLCPFAKNIFDDTPELADVLE